METLPILPLLLLKCALAMVVILIPAWALLRSFGFAAANRADFLLALMVVGSGYQGAFIYLAGLAGIYTRLTLLLFTLLPLVLLLRRSDRAIVFPRPKTFHSQSARTAGVFITFITGYLFLNSLTSPFRVWDALVSWDKWAADWGAASNMRNYLFGGYGQLLPTVDSIVYKLAGTGNQVLPQEMFVLHGLQVFWVVMLALSLYRLGQLLGAAPPLALLLFFGWHGATSTLFNGYSDTASAATCAAALALTVGRNFGYWGCRRAEFVVLGASYFAAMFSKLAGALWVTTSVLLSVFLKRHGAKGIPARQQWFTVGAAAIPILLFVVHQAYVNSIFSISDIDPSAHMFTFAAVKNGIGAHMHLIRTAGPWNPMKAAFDSLTSGWLNQPTLKALQILLGVCTVLGIVAALRDRRFAFYILFGAAFCSLLLFLNTAAYDIRNGLPAVAVLSVVAARGLTMLSEMLSIRLRAVAVWMLSIVAMTSTFVAVLPNAYTHPVDRAPWAQRLRWIDLHETQARVLAFFPEYSTELGFVNYLGHTEGGHVITPSPLYRLFAGGLYPYREFSWAFAKTGDVALSNSPLQPQPPADWLPINVSSTTRGWIKLASQSNTAIRALRVTGVHPPELSVTGSGAADVLFKGEQSFLVALVEPKWKNRPVTVLWRFVLNKDAKEVKPFYLTSLHGGINKGINGGATRLWTEALGTDRFLACGILTLEPGFDPTNKADNAIVGITATPIGYLAKLYSSQVAILQ